MKKCKNPDCFSDGCCRDGMCPTHTRADRPIRPHTSGRKRPTNSQAHLGVELECVANGTAVKALCSQSRVPCYDGSLNGGIACEFKICLPASKAIRAVPKLATKLASLGAVVNSSCGLHVHLDARHVKPSRIYAFLYWLETWQEWWFGLMPPSRRENTYCRRLNSGNHNSHYTWANRTDFQTVEIRIHGGTLNPHKLAGWLAVCTDLMALLHSDKDLPVIGSGGPTDEQLEEIFVRDEGLQYLRSRHAGNGILSGATINNPNGPTVESEVE